MSLNSPVSLLPAGSSFSTDLRMTTTTAGGDVPPGITEVGLVYPNGHREFPLARLYLQALPRVGEGLFLVFDDPVRDDSLVLKFTVSQVCHVCLDQSELPVREKGRDYPMDTAFFRVSNQAILYVVPRGNETIGYCTHLIEEAIAGEHAPAQVATHERAEAAVAL